MFELKNVSLTVGSQTQRRLLDNVSYQFEQGRITAILGANGAGKSTLMKVLLNEHTDIHGEVQFNGFPLQHLSLAYLSRFRAYIAQSFRPAFDLSAGDYLMLARESVQESEEACVENIERIATMFSIQHLLEHSIETLSGGEFQLIEFARAWLQLLDGESMKGKCLLLDEPSSALDIKQSHLLYMRLKMFCRAGGTVIIIDHDINQMANLADNIVMLRNGQIVHADSTELAFTNPNINHCFDIAGHLLEQAGQRAYVIQPS